MGVEFKAPVFYFLSGAQYAHPNVASTNSFAMPQIPKFELHHSLEGCRAAIHFGKVHRKLGFPVRASFLPCRRKGKSATAPLCARTQAIADESRWMPDWRAALSTHWRK